MRVAELQTRVAERHYVVDPDAVAVALLARIDPTKDPVVVPPLIRPGAGAREERARPAGRST
jgi:hypothetical protein